MVVDHQATLSHEMLVFTHLQTTYYFWFNVQTERKMISGPSSSATLANRSEGMLMLIAVLVLLLHVTAIIWLRQSKVLPNEYNPPLPFKLEVTLLGKDSPKSIKTPPQTNPQPKSVF